MKKSGFLVLILLLWAASTCFGQMPPPLMLQKPAVSRTQIAFSYAGDLWIVDRNGGDARRLTTGVGVETDPHFSPDGKTLAFTGEYDGNVDVYTVPAAGGVPKRLTTHPDEDRVVGWTPDGTRILFSSARGRTNRVGTLWTVSVNGGMPTKLPLPTAVEGSYSPDGTKLAYVPTLQFQQAWKRYRGGQTKPIWIVNLADLRVEKIPRENSNDYAPMWVGSKIFFLSDRNGPVSLYAYDTGTKRVSEIVRNTGFDIKSASAGPDSIVYEQFGSLQLVDLPACKEHTVNVRLAGDMPEMRPHFLHVGSRIRNARLSPTGVRVVVEAHGEVLTVPAEKGDIRNLTNTPGVMERDPAWSPDGKWIAYFSDESGEYALHLRRQNGAGEVKKLNLGSPPSFFYNPTWSPDSKKIAYTDKRLNLWYIDIDKGTPVKVDTDTYESPFPSIDPAWSPDSKWLTYTKQLKSHLHVVYVYAPDTGQTHPITDGMSDARFPVFDKNGKYLYFTASTDTGLTIGWLDMSSYERPVTRSAYVVVLRKDLPSPLAPESDEEKETAETKSGAPAAGEKKEAGKSDKEGATQIDFDNIGQRILALPIPARNYSAMASGKSGILFLLEGPIVFSRQGANTLTLHKFDLATRKVDKFADGVSDFDVSFNGEKIGLAQGPRYAIVSTAAPPAPGSGALNLSEMEIQVDPQAEWRQMYHEVWRIERDFLYDPGLHGVDVPAMEKRYAPFLAGIASREDLNYLFTEMLGEITVGHMFIGGGDEPQPAHVGVGLLGADYTVENGRYRFARVYNGENWNPELKAPLTQPGVNVMAGEYLLAVNGREVKAPDEIYRFFEGTAGKQTVLKVGPNPDGTGAREAIVVPVGSEYGLRNLAWIEDNRRKVDKLSNGRLAYVYLPNTAGAGYTNFNRYYLSQAGKEGAILDERFNGGGSAADYIIDYLRRPLMNYWTARSGDDISTPLAAIYGPKAMITNEYAGSGGDLMPWLFRKAGIGPLIGKRTWGGLVGIYGYPELMDGGGVTAPRVAFWNPNGTWDVENHGVTPDIEVEMDPRAVADGHDPQLERAVAVVMASLEKNPLPTHKRPAYPNYQKKP